MARRAEARTYWLDGARERPRPLSESLPSLLGGRVVPATFFLMIALAKAQSLVRLAAAPPQGADWLATAGFYASCVHRVAAIAFMALVVICFVIRMNPVRSARSPLQIVVALLGSYLMTFVAMSPETPTGPIVTVLAAAIMLAGSVFTAIALLFLGRSFSITPEARKLVTGGLYSVVRHPMYLGEMLGSFGMFLQALSPLTLLIFVFFCAMQIKRMDFEEIVLQRVFPDYTLYKTTTARLIPGLY